MSFGYTQALWLKESATYGSSEDLSTGTRYVLPVKPNISVEKTLARIKTEHIRGTAGMKQEEDQLGIESVQGSFGGIVPCKGDFGIVLKNMLGKVVTTGASSPYTHDFQWTDKLFVGFSLAINKGDATYVSHGCQFKSLKLSAKVGGPLEWTADIVGRTEAQIATVTAPTLPTLLAGTPYWLFQHGTFELDTVAEPITEFSVDCVNELAESDSSSYSIGSVLRSLLSRTGYGVTGTVKRRHDKDATQVSKFYAKFLSGAVARVKLSFTNPSDANYSLSISLGMVKFEGKTPNASDKGLLFEEIPFVAYDLDSAATNYIDIIDAQAAPVTATGAYDGAGA
jgi:hypothetical protein